MNVPGLNGQQVRDLAADGMPGHVIAEMMVNDGTMTEIGAYEYVSFLLHGDQDGSREQPSPSEQLV